MVNESLTHFFRLRKKLEYPTIRVLYFLSDRINRVYFFKEFFKWRRLRHFEHRIGNLKPTYSISDNSNLDGALLKSVEERSNNRQKSFIVDKIHAHFGPDLTGRTFALWAAGATVRAHDPKAMEECRRIYGDKPDLVLCASRDAALEGADALILVTEWKTFNVIDFDEVKAVLRHPVIFDGRNIYDPVAARRHGITLYALGRRLRRFSIEPLGGGDAHAALPMGRSTALPSRKAR